MPQPSTSSFESDAGRPSKGAVRSALLRRKYPRLYRVAAALTGSTGEAESVANAVLIRALKQSIDPTKTVDTDRWFLHHTVLAAREIVRLNGYAASTEPLFGSFHDAVSSLPTQQREAFLLHHGESLDLRGLATAMDCSTTAAANHLAAAAQRLSSAGPNLGSFTTLLPALIATGTPPEDRIWQTVERQIVRITHRHRLSIFIQLLITAAVLASLVWLAARLWRELIV